METRRAYFRNMRSKCRCSCVLQFTRHHRVSSVLHRPPSQMIHCIVLCFLILGPEVQSVHDANTSQRRRSRLEKPDMGGDQNPFRGESSLNCWIFIPNSTDRGPKRVQYLKQARRDEGADIRSGPLTGDVRAGAGRPRLRGGRPQEGSAVPRGFLWVRVSTGVGHATDNDPSAGSPTETLLRLLLPLNATVWSSSRQADRVIRRPVNPRTSLKHSIGSSDGRCVQRAGT